ncbi:hypothetical protein PybrP1_003819 [[Pythium] brassicae (nom. inval.)]|nr:hypothetical protein PybrP1_003819 [[Pythium] brassicae (nom. inval.)]
MAGKKVTRGSAGSSRVLPLLPGCSSVKPPSLANLPEELKGLPAAEVLKQISLLASHDSFASLLSLRHVATGQADSWRDEFRRQGVFKRAFWAVLMMLRNASLCVACAALLTFLCNLGVLSSRSPREQSYTLYLVATMFWVHLFLCAAILLAQACFLVGLRFSAKPDEPATLLFCLRRLYSTMYTSYFVSMALHLGVAVAIGTYLPVELRKYRLEFYLSSFGGHVFTASAVVSTRRVFQRETVAGRKHVNREASEAKSVLERARYFAKTYVRYLVALFAVAFAGLFVHATHHFHVVSHGELWLAVGGSIAFKFLLQEATKMCVFSRKMSDIRFMWVAIGAPTVMVDTHLRIALQRSDSLRFLLSGFVVMGLSDVGLRAARVVFAKLEIQQVTEQLYPTTVSAAIRQFRRERESRAAGQVRGASSSANALQRKKRRILSLHTAETYAGMAAEYIAIGCSTSLLYFFWDHAKYELRLVGDPYRTDLSAEPDSDAHAIKAAWSSLTILVAQLAVKITVGYLTSLLEIGAGIDFDELRRYGPSVFAMLLCMTIINMHISTIMLMRVT